MSTAIPPTVLAEILASKSYPETTAALLNETERKFSFSQSKPHGNSRYVYPYWKACQNCGKPFQTHNRAQAKRNKTCSADCAKALIGKANAGTKPLNQRNGKEVACAVCGTPTWKPDAWLRKVKAPTCSRECNGKLRGQDWVNHAHKGRANWTPESEAALKDRMTGKTNPAWKGGLTYRNRKGAYANQPIKYVRCPPEMASMARKDGYVMEHRLNVAMALGRPLTRSECVHHINHDATDNRLANLMLFKANGDHKAFEHGAAIKPLWCGLSHSTTQAKCGACECQRAHLSQSATE
jgi:hypothetical protein